MSDLNKLKELESWIEDVVYRWPNVTQLGTYNPDSIELLRNIADSLEAAQQRIAELDAALRASSELQTVHREDKEVAEKELAALRSKVKPAESYSDDADLSFQIDWYDDERNDGIQIAMWLKELRRRREMAAPVAVPDKKERLENVVCTAEIYLQGKGDGFNEAVDEVLRLNIGSKTK